MGKGRKAWRCFENGKNGGYYYGQEHKVVCQFQTPGTKDLRKERHESGLKLELELGFK